MQDDKFPMLIAIPEPGEYKLSVSPDGDYKYEHTVNATGTKVIVESKNSRTFDREISVLEG